MTTQLSLYNGALTKYLGERKLASLTENRKPRRVLDQIWDSGGFTKGVLEDGLWNFATRTFRSEYNPSVNPDFGFKYAHDKPTDWVRTSAISLSDYFSDSLMAYNDEAQYWFLDQPTIYIRIISNDSSYGGDLSLWSDSAVDYAEVKLASLACLNITQDKEMTRELKAEAKNMLRTATSRDAMNDPAVFPPTGSWVRARRGGRRGPPTNIRTV